MLKKGKICRCSGGEKAFKGLLFLLSALVGVALFTESTSPLFSGWGYDSAMFQTIGKYWAEGYLPYVDLYDHKGPMIFFINALGYGLDGRNGVYIIQVLSIALSEAIACRLLADRLGRGKSLALALLLPFVLAANWQEGNTTEEYILPLLLGSYLLMARWCGDLEEGRFTHRARAAFVYGLCFGFALMTRVTNALGVCLGVAFITVLLAVKGEWKNLLANAGAFLLGTAVPVLPFCVYFAAHGALYDMWYGTLLYNLDYLSSSGFPRPEGLVQLLVLVRLYLPGWCLIGAALWSLLPRGRERRRLAAMLWLLVAVGNTAFLYTLNRYAHYGIVLLPFFYVAVWMLAGGDGRQGLRKLSAGLALCMTAAVLLSAGLRVYKNYTVRLPDAAYEEMVDYGDGYEELAALIPQEERDSFVAFNCPRRLYLEQELRPAFRFFTLQQWMMDNSPGLSQTMEAEFRQAEVQWVLSFDADGVNAGVREMLEDGYDLVAQSPHQVYKLYHLRGY